eukprot:742611-Amphidinium_carterae.1
MQMYFALDTETCCRLKVVPLTYRQRHSTLEDCNNVHCLCTTGAVHHVSDGLTGLSQGSCAHVLKFDMIVCNPPIHNPWGE